MSTSGSYDFSVTRNEVIKGALRSARIIGKDQTPTDAEISTGAEALNMIVKQWQGKADFAPGLKMYSRHRVTVFLQKGQERYLIGPASSDDKATTRYGRTTLSAAEASGQTVLSITSNSDSATYPGTTVTMTAGDVIGVQLDDGTIHWSTISGTPAATATIAAQLTSAAAAGNYVYWFTARAQRPVVVETAVLRDANIKDIPLGIYSDVAQYERLPDKQADGDPTSILVEYQRLNTAITCNTQPDDVTKQLRLTVLYPAEDYDAAGDDIAFPQEWFRALKFQLGLDLWPEYKDGDPPAWLRKLRDESLMMAQNVNPETVDVCFEPDR